MQQCNTVQNISEGKSSVSSSMKQSIRQCTQIKIAARKMLKTEPSQGLSRTVSVFCRRDSLKAAFLMVMMLKLLVFDYFV